MMRIGQCRSADGRTGWSGMDRRVAAMAVLANDTAETPRCDQQRTGAGRVG
jgi:hypothetical protein